MKHRSRIRINGGEPYELTSGEYAAVWPYVMIDTRDFQRTNTKIVFIPFE